MNPCACLWASVYLLLRRNHALAHEGVNRVEGSHRYRDAQRALGLQMFHWKAVAGEFQTVLACESNKALPFQTVALLV